MKTTALSLTLFLAVAIAACNTSKKGSTSTTGNAPNPPSTTTVTAAKPANGVYVPGNEELAAIQLKYADATLDKLKEGHAIYAYGPCVNCHGAKNIYTYDELRWEKIIDDMAKMAKLTDPQKDAVYKYVLAIKATQPK